MRLYHGSNQIISCIDLKRSKAYKDFGKGFYMTRDYARAVAMAQRITAIIYSIAFVQQKVSNS